MAPGIDLVFMRQQQVDAAREQVEADARDLVVIHVDQGQALARALPLLDEALHVGLKGNAQRLKQ